MEKMRASTTYILWLLILSFGLLWVLADTHVFDAVMRGPRNLGSVNGEVITIDDFNNRVRYYTEQYSNRTGESVTPEMRAYYEEQAWNELVASRLMEQKMDEMGIKVTDQEIVNMITGENPDPFIKQQFQKEDGTIDRVALNAAIESPENKQIWISIEQQLRQKRRQQKMNNYISSSLQVSDKEVEEQYVENNTTASFDYVRFPYADIPESQLNVTDSDLREYYDNHEDQYKRKRTYRFEYVTFSKAPTKKDTTRTLNELKRLRSQFAEAENDSTFFSNYQSDSKYNPNYVAKANVRDEFQPVLDLDSGQVSDVIMISGTGHLLKKLAEKRDSVKFADFSLNVEADPVATVDAQAEEASDFSFFAEQDDFDGEAKRRNLEVKEAMATKGTPFVAGLGQSQQILNFLNKSSEDQISESIELDNQFVVLKVTDIQPAGIRPLDEVKDQVRSRVLNQKRIDQTMQHVSELIGQNEDLAAIAGAADQKVQNAEGVSMSSTVIPGAGREPKVVGAIFGLNEGAVSQPIEGNNAVFVVKVNSISKADPANLTASAKQQIRRSLQQQQQRAFMSVWLKELKDQADIVDNRDQLLK